MESKGDFVIQKIFFENFKSFQKSELKVEQISVLMGSNASGKSNAIEGIRILADISTGQPLSIILDGAKNMEGAVRGGSKACARFNSDYFILGCTCTCDGYELEYRIRVCVEKGVYSAQEQLERVYSEGKRENIFIMRAVDTESSAAIADCQSDRFDYSHREIKVNRFSAALPQLENRLPTDSKVLVQSTKDIHALLLCLEKIVFLNPVPSKMRDYSRVNEIKLRSDAENISAVLYDLCVNQPDGNENKGRLLNIIHALPENEVDGIGFVTTALDDVMLTLSERYSEKPMDAKRLSDGTLRCIGIAAALITAEPKGILLIEEVDNGIHPSRAKILLQMMIKLAKEKQLAIVTTTHNPVLLDAVQGEFIEGVSLCYRNPMDGSSEIRQIVEMEDYLRLAAKGSIGKLVIGDEFVKAIHDNGAQKKSYDWLGI